MSALETSQADRAPTVLIVEDEPAIAAQQADLVEDAGYRVVAAVGDGESALVMAEYTRPDVALIDVALRGPLDGITVGRELNRRYGTMLVFVTARLDRAVAQMRDSDALFVGKPFHGRDLLETIRAALGKRHEPPASLA